MPSLHLLKDDPRSDDPHDDVLGQQPALDTLDTAIRSLRPPACIALYGSWGSGKTTLMDRAHRGWTTTKDGVPVNRGVWFNPWEYERRDDLLTPLLHAVVQQIKDERSFNTEEFKRLAVGAAKVMISLSMRVGTAAVLGSLTGTPLARVSNLYRIEPEKHAELFNEWSHLQDEIQQVQKQFADLVNQALGDRPSPLVFFLDDLDRCLPDSTVALIEGVKLLLCGHADCKALFVFALDRQIVGEAIRNRYGSDSLYTGENYLEKIFDLSLEVPGVSQEQMDHFIRSQYEDRDGPVEWLYKTFKSSSSDGLALIRQVLAVPAFANPRVVKRTLNRLTLLLADENRRLRVSGIGEEPRYRRLVAWAAGAERFRSFRTFFQSASDDELRALQQIASPARGRVKLDEILANYPGAARITSQLGFPAYLELLDLQGNRAQVIVEQRERTSGLQTLGDFDDLLRSAGL